MKDYCVYVHIAPSNRKYVGISCDPKKRWNEGRGYSKNYIFYRAIKKYGWDNIEHKILYSGLDLEEAKEIEANLISEWHLTDRKYGYNLIDTKNGVSEETRQLMSAARKGNNYCEGRELSDQTRQKISDSLKRHFSDPKNRDKLHRPHSEETKEKLRQRVFSEETRARMSLGQHRRDCSGSRNPSAKAVRQLTLTGEPIKEYEYAKLAAQEHNIDLSSIIKCCRNKQKTCGGYRWEYV